MRVRVTKTTGDLATDLRTIAVKAKPEMARSVHRQVDNGTELARGFARAAAGIHGLNYFKRISGEMTGALQGEFGPHGEVDNNAVGAGWRHAHNTDLARAADIIHVQFGDDVLDAVDGLFWPGA